MEDRFFIKNQMLCEAINILKTVSFLERQIKQKILEISDADDEYNDIWADHLRRQLRVLLLKLNREDVMMDEFILKYQHLIQHEKKTLLSNSNSKKTFHLRSVSSNSSRT